MKMYMIWLVFVLLCFGCDSAQKPKNDASNDAGTDIDTVDVVDIQDVTDVHDADITDADVHDADGDIEPQHDPYQVYISSRAYGYGAYYPYLFINEIYTGGTSSIISTLNLETGNVESSTIIPYIGQTVLVPAPWENAVYFSAYSVNPGGFPSELPIENILYRMDTETFEITDVTSMFDNVRSPVCGANNGIAKLQSIDNERGWFLFDCIYVQNDFVVRELYRINVNTQELQYASDGLELYFHSYGYTRPWHINRNYIIGTFNDRNGTSYSGNTRHMVFDLSGDTPSVIWDGRNLTVLNGAGAQVSSDNYFCENRLNGEYLDVVCENLIDGTIIMPPEPTEHRDTPMNLSSDLPHLNSWTQGYGDAIGNDWLQSYGGLGNMIMWDKSNNVIRQVTYDTVTPFYGVAEMIPGDPENRWILYCGPSSSAGIQLFIKDLRSSGILDETGHLIPETK